MTTVSAVAGGDATGRGLLPPQQLVIRETINRSGRSSPRRPRARRRRRGYWWRRLCPSPNRYAGRPRPPRRPQRPGSPPTDCQQKPTRRCRPIRFAASPTTIRSWHTTRCGVMTRMPTSAARSVLASWVARADHILCLLPARDRQLLSGICQGTLQLSKGGAK